MKPSILIGAVVLGALSAPAAFAGESAVFQANPTTNSVNNQQNSGSVVLNPSGGTQVNNNVNNAFSSTYSFGPGISCPTPSLAFNAYGLMVILEPAVGPMELLLPLLFLLAVTLVTLARLW